MLLCRGDREAALGADEAGAKRKKGDSARAIAKRAGHVCSLLVHEPDLVDACSSLVHEPEGMAALRNLLKERQDAFEEKMAACRAANKRLPRDSIAISMRDLAERGVVMTILKMSNKVSGLKRV